MNAKWEIAPRLALRKTWVAILGMAITTSLLVMVSIPLYGARVKANGDNHELPRNWQGMLNNDLLVFGFPPIVSAIMIGWFGGYLANGMEPKSRAEGRR